jgi:hypothetical protein
LQLFDLRSRHFAAIWCKFAICLRSHGDHFLIWNRGQQNCK